MTVTCEIPTTITKLPEIDKEVIFVTYHNEIFVGRRRGEGLTFCVYNAEKCKYVEIRDVIAWAYVDFDSYTNSLILSDKR